MSGNYLIVVIAVIAGVGATAAGVFAYYFSSPTQPSNTNTAPARGANPTANTNTVAAAPVGSNLTKTDISRLFEIFDDQPLSGGQVPPRISKWVDNDTFIFLQFDRSDPHNATSLRYVGIGVKGVFCAESQPDAVNGSFTHFHQWNGSEYRHAHGSQPGDQGYWMTWVAVDEFKSFDGRQVKPGVDYDFSLTPPPSCGDNVPVAQFNVSGPDNISKEDLLELASFFDDQPFQGGQTSPRVAKWANNDTFIFLQFDKPDPTNATAINYVGIGTRGIFCEQSQPSIDFTHFHKWNATEYRHGHGTHTNDEGYWLLWVTTNEFDVQNRHVTPGVDRAFSPTPPPSCSN